MTPIHHKIIYCFNDTCNTVKPNLLSILGAYVIFAYLNSTNVLFDNYRVQAFDSDNKFCLNLGPKNLIQVSFGILLWTVVT